MEKATQTTTNPDHTVESLRFLTPEQVRTVREQFGTPTFVYDELSLERQAKTMLSFPNAFGLTVYYSLKGGANGAIIKLFDRLGLHFDASSIWEALRAMAVGVTPSKILLTAQEVPPDFGQYVERGMEYNACSLRQLETYGKQFPGREVSIRVNPGTGTGFINRLTSGGPRASFGIWYEYLDDVRALEEVSAQGQAHSSSHRFRSRSGSVVAHRCGHAQHREDIRARFDYQPRRRLPGEGVADRA